jgi:hypothetical protein
MTFQQSFAKFPFFGRMAGAPRGALVLRPAAAPLPCMPPAVERFDATAPDGMHARPGLAARTIAADLLSRS